QWRDQDGHREHGKNSGCSTKLHCSVPCRESEFQADGSTADGPVFGLPRRGGNYERAITVRRSAKRSPEVSRSGMASSTTVAETPRRAVVQRQPVEDSQDYFPVLQLSATFL